MPTSSTRGRAARPAGFTQGQQLDHARHDVRLRDRLTTADGQRAIRVRVSAPETRHERLARHEAHGRQRRGIADAARRELHLEPSALGPLRTLVARAGTALPSIRIADAPDGRLAGRTS